MDPEAIQCLCALVNCLDIPSTCGDVFSNSLVEPRFCSRFPPAKFYCHQSCPGGNGRKTCQCVGFPPPSVSSRSAALQVSFPKPFRKIPNPPSCQQLRLPSVSSDANGKPNAMDRLSGQMYHCTTSKVEVHGFSSCVPARAWISCVEDWEMGLV